jgi:hypothetical protein
MIHYAVSCTYQESSLRTHQALRQNRKGIRITMMPRFEAAKPHAQGTEATRAMHNLLPLLLTLCSRSHASCDHALLPATACLRHAAFLDPQGLMSTHSRCVSSTCSSFSGTAPWSQTHKG